MPPLSEPDPVRASAELVESVAELVRAEARLAVSELKALLRGALVALLLTWAAFSLVPVALLVLSLLPVIGRDQSWLVTSLAVLPLLSLASAAAIGAAVTVRRRVDRAIRTRPERERPGSEATLRTT